MYNGDPFDGNIVEIECAGGSFTSAWVTFKDLTVAEAAVERYNGELSKVRQWRLKASIVSDHVPNESNKFLSNWLRDEEERQSKTTRTVQVTQLPDPHTRRGLNQLIETFVGDHTPDPKAIAVIPYDGGTGMVQWHDELDAKGFIMEYNGMYFKNATLYAYCVDDDEIGPWLPAPKVNKSIGSWVGNLKAGISEEDLKKMFTPFTLESVNITSPSKEGQSAFAFVWMAHNDAAAFYALHPKGFKYHGKWIKVRLMKGKGNVISAVAPAVAPETSSASVAMDKLTDKTATLTVKDADQDNKKAAQTKPAVSNGFTDVRIGNLSYSAKKPDLRDLFKDFETTKIVVKEGYGFVGLRSLQDAQAAYSRLSGKKILGRAVTVKITGPPPSRS
jgi:hypothetical protein